MEEIQCIFCSKSNHDLAIRENGFSGVRCKDCHLIYISPRPDPNEVTHLYTDEHAVLYADAQFQFDAFNRMEAARTLSKIQKIKERGAILEIGPGGGGFLSEARRLGYDPHGIELNPIEARWINEELKIPCETAILSPTSFNGQTFDIIYHRDVLSHLSDPIGAFRMMHRALKSDGLLVFETGNIADVDPRYMKYFSQFSYPDHLFFFGEKSLIKLMAMTGFTQHAIHRDPILLQLILQKMLWRLKNSLKDEKVADAMDTPNEHRERKTLSAKRWLRNAYRYTRHYLVRLGRFLPPAGRPLKLLVFAHKDTT